MSRVAPVEWFTAIFAIAYGLLIWRIGGSGPAVEGWLVVDVGLAGAALVGLPLLRRARSPVLQYLGVGLPMLAFYIIYRQSSLALSQTHGAWHEATIATLDRRFVPRLATTPPEVVREWLAFSYLTYIPILVGGTAALFGLTARGVDAPAERAVRQVCLALASCYVVFVCYPVLSPRFTEPSLQAARLGAGIFSRLAVLNQQHGMVHGDSFPSAHLAATVVVLTALYESRRVLFWGLLPIAVSLSVGAVYFGYHYVTDVLAGAGVGFVAVGIDRWRMSKRATAPWAGG